MSGNEMLATFWPTVGTVFPGLGAGAPSGRGWKRAFIWERRVVLPALSRPRRRTEYSNARAQSRRLAYSSPYIVTLVLSAYPPCWWQRDTAILPDGTSYGVVALRSPDQLRHRNSNQKLGQKQCGRSRHRGVCSVPLIVLRSLFVFFWSLLAVSVSCSLVGASSAADGSRPASAAGLGIRA